VEMGKGWGCGAKGEVRKGGGEQVIKLTPSMLGRGRGQNSLGDVIAGGGKVSPKKI